MRNRLIKICCMFIISALYGCAAEVGSPEWCEEMNSKPKGEWTMNETKDFAKHCLFNVSE